jgi:WD40 repeat protein
VAVGCGNGEVSFIDWKQGTVMCVMRHHTVEVHCLRWSHLGIENVETQAEAGEESKLQKKSVELLVSAAPGERLRIYETRYIEGDACSSSKNNSIPPSPLGKGREIALISSLPLPKPPGNLAQGQRHRLWLSADWLPAPVLRQKNGILDVWMLTSGYGGGLLARKVLLQGSEQSGVQASGENILVEGEQPLVRLPGGHSRTVFSVRCMLDLSREEPGVRILTIGMDRAAMAWWAPVPRLHRNFLNLEAEAKLASSQQMSSKVDDDDDDVEMLNAAYEAEKKAWQRTELAGSITGLGSFPQALSIFPRKLQVANLVDEPLLKPPKVAVGCGDGSIRILPFQQNDATTTTTTSAADHLPVPQLAESFSMLQIDSEASTMIWQGIPAPVTTILWHPTAENILAFGCSDGSIGMVHCGKGTAILAMTKHKAGISRMAWISSSDASPSTCFCLVTLSSDGSLFQWTHWPESSLSDLFPAQPKQQQQQKQQGTAVIPRKELGRPSPLTFSALSSTLPSSTSAAIALEKVIGLVIEKERENYAPTCLGSNPGNDGSALVGCADGGVFVLKDGSIACQISQHQFQQQEGEVASKEVAAAAAAVAQVAVYENFYASLHTDRTLHIGAVSETQLQTLACASLATTAEGLEDRGAGDGKVEIAAAEVVMTMALVSKNDPLSSVVYVALGLQDGTIQIWSFTTTPEQQQTNQKDGISLVTTLRGHAAPVVSLEWIILASPAVDSESLQEEVMLFSGSEDQSVRKWDLAMILKKQQERRAEQTQTPLVQEQVGGDGAKDAGSINNSNFIGNEEDVPPPPPPPLPLNPSENIALEEEKQIPERPIISSSTTTTNKTKPGSSTTHTPPATTTTSLAAHQVSLASKGVLPPSLSRAETLEEQAPLDAVLVALTAQVAAAAGGADTSSSPNNSYSNDEIDYFATLGCVVDPLAAMPALHNASTSLLAGPSQRPAAARVLAQRAAAVSLWAGDVGSAIKVLVENDALTADFVSFSAAAGRGAWEAASRAYAFLLEERGEPHLAALHLASIGDPVAACRVYTRVGMVREAASFAAAKLPRTHQLVVETRFAYALQLEGRGDFERAAAQHIASENWIKAIEMLQKRATVGSLQTALEILSIIGEKSKGRKRAKEESMMADEQVEELTRTLQNSLSEVKAKKLDDTTAHSADTSLRGFSSLNIEATATASQRQRYSNETLEQIKRTLLNKEDTLNKHFQARVCTQFPQLTPLLLLEDTEKTN